MELEKSEELDSAREWVRDGRVPEDETEERLVVEYLRV